MDLSLYKDESQLDKASPRKRKRGAVKSEAGDDEESESDEEETEDEEPLKKKNNATSSRGAAAKKTTVQKKIMDSESTGSDDENLLEIRKRSKNQVINQGLIGLDCGMLMMFYFDLDHTSSKTININSTSTNKCCESWHKASWCQNTS